MGTAERATALMTKRMMWATGRRESAEVSTSSQSSRLPPFLPGGAMEN